MFYQCSLKRNTKLIYKGIKMYNSILYRTVNVILDPYFPYIKLNGNNVIKIKVGTSYIEQNVSVYDYNTMYRL